MGEKVIYMPRIACRLREMGFPILRTEVNYKKPQYDVYVFEESESLERALGIILEERKKYSK